jgi:AraC-like DNA-binding protein
MEYRIIDHRSSDLTRKYVLDMYELKNGSDEAIYGCVPNGEIGISVIVSGENSICTNGQWKKQVPVSVYGLVKKVQFHRMSPHYREINIGFQPQFLHLFMQEGMSALLENTATDLSDLIGRYEAERLFMSIGNAGNDREIVIEADAFLARQLQLHKYDRRVFAAYEYVAGRKLWNVNDLGFMLNLSTVALRSLFHERVGISPKELIQIMRIKAALQSRVREEESLTSLACRLGYFDQSHFIHDFKRVVGLSPKKYFSNKDLTFDFYNFGRWRYDSFVKHGMISG